MTARLTLAALMIGAAVAAAMAVLTGAPAHCDGTEHPVTVGGMLIAQHCGKRDDDTPIEE